MLKKFFMFIAFLTVVLLGNIPFVKAQETPQPEAVQADTMSAIQEPAAQVALDDLGDADEITDEFASANDEDFAFGTVVSVAENSITILEYDFDTESEKETIYIANAETQFENATSLKDIVANDEVEINYKELDGIKTATFISKDLPIEEGDEAYLDDLGIEEEQGAASTDSIAPSVPATP